MIGNVIGWVLRKKDCLIALIKLLLRRLTRLEDLEVDPAIADRDMPAIADHDS